MKSFAYNSFTYYFLRFIFFPIGLLPYRAIHFLGKTLGTIVYWFAPSKIKKITYNNLALAKTLNLNEKQIKKISKEAFQNLIINSLEYFRLKRSKDKIHHFVKSRNLEAMHKLYEKGQGSICVTGHISNWELCFLESTQKFPATAIGKQIKNPKLYNFILSIREMHKGKIIEMKNAISDGIKSLKGGASFSMVNDQAYTSSSYSYPFFGVRAWTSAAPALMAYKANVPIFPVSTRRLKGGKYEFTLSDPIWPDTTKPLKQEVNRVMDLLMKELESKVREEPGQWLWQHKRWKQEGYNYIIHEYKADSILIVLPENEKIFDWINEGAWTIPQIYTRSFLTFMIPEKFQNKWKLKGHEVLTYSKFKDILIRDYRFQMIYDFCNQPKIGKHFLKLGAHTVYSLENLIERSVGFSQVDLEPRFATFLPNILCLKEARFKVPV